MLEETSRAHLADPLAQGRVIPDKGFSSLHLKASSDRDFITFLSNLF